MKLDKKKKLAGRVFRTGTDRIAFDNSRLADIKEAITREDFRQLLREGAIKIKPKTKNRRRAGRKRMLRRRKGRKRGIGKRKIIKKNKREYPARVRKMRKYLRKMKESGKLKEDYQKLRREIKAGVYKSIKQLKEVVK